MTKFKNWLSRLTESKEAREMRELAEAVAYCLGVDPEKKDNWVGKFELHEGDKTLQCEIYSSVLHVGNDSLILMNQQEIDSEIGKVCLVDFFTSEYTMRLLRMPDPETGKMIFMIAKSVRQEIQYTVKVDITFFDA
jgi:hypothetical protein